MHEFLTVLDLPLAAPQIWALRDNTEFDEHLAAYEKQIFALVWREVSKDEEDEEVLTRKCKLTFRENPVPRALRSLLKNPELAIHTIAKWHVHKFDEAHPYEFTVEPPALADRISISGKQWVVPVSESMCRMYCRDCVKVTRMPGLVISQIEKVIFKGMVDSYNLFPWRVQAFIDAKPHLFPASVRERDSAPALSCKSMRLSAGRAKEEPQPSDAPRPPALWRGLPPPTALRYPPAAGLPREVRMAAVAGWMLKMGRSFPYRWYQRFYAFDEVERRLLVYIFKRDRGFVFRGQARVVVGHALAPTPLMLLELQQQELATGRVLSQGRRLLLRPRDEEEQLRWLAAVNAASCEDASEETAASRPSRSSARLTRWPSQRVSLRRHSARPPPAGALPSAESGELTQAQQRAAVRLQAVARGRRERASSGVRLLGRPALPPRFDDATVEGWLEKRGAGFPYKWQPRYFVFMASTKTVHYFASDGVEGSSYETKGEVVITALAPGAHPLELVFEVASSAIADGKAIGTDSPAASRGRTLLARAFTSHDHAKWVASWGEALRSDSEAQAAVKLQAAARGRRERALSASRHGRPQLPQGMDGATVEGWLVKRGTGFPYKWQRRYFVYFDATRTLHYFSTESNGETEAKGEVVISSVKPYTVESFGLKFEISSSSRAGGQSVVQEKANQSRSLLARAANKDEQTRWIAAIGMPDESLLPASAPLNNTL